MKTLSLLIALAAGVSFACTSTSDESERATASPTTGDAVQQVSTTASAPQSVITPSASTTPSTLTMEEQVRRMVLQPSDLPPGFSQIHESFATNEEVANAGDDAAQVLAQLTEWGRILGRSVAYSSESSGAFGGLMVQSTASLYQSDSGAAASFADEVNTARTTDWAAAAGEALDVSVEEIPPLDIADEMLWLHLSGTAVISKQPFTYDVVRLRVGRADGSIDIVSMGADVALQVQDIVRAQAANMAAGLP